MGRKSKAKGSSFERDICRSLSKWLTAGTRDDILWRSSMSGGRATVRLSKGDSSPHISGDICAVHPEGNHFIKHFFPECKNYRDLQITAFALEHSGILVSFWQEARKQASAHKKFPMLIFKMMRRPICVGLSTFGADFLNIDEEQVLIRCPALDMHVINFDQLLSQSYPHERDS